MWALAGRLLLSLKCVVVLWSGTIYRSGFVSMYVVHFFAFVEENFNEGFYWLSSDDAFYGSFRA